ncbi:NEDD8-activating enzyme E1 catalytic subunit-like [Watersipora subatra]|uniref:NEDD8-activating enzyme E1 catalytic subunit-like n=1 Tax=Watersipora subatra TaxID=2589382 RepID=UPI00355B1790
MTGRWRDISKLLERNSPFVHPDFEPSSETLPFLQSNCKVLVIGAGGLGCELLKDLALSGFTDISVIDMDTIDLSNLNRQFLFRKEDVGKAKADVAAAFVNGRVEGCQVKAHCNRIEDFDESFYSQFHIVVCGLDSIVARRWLNSMLVGLLRYDDSGTLDMTSIIPMVDGGTEGFKGNIRVVLPGISACLECTLDLYPPQVNYPMCTIAHTPRLPVHCIEYVKVLLWPQEKPFGENVGIDGDNPDHILWILEKSKQRADEFNITGVTHRLTQGVVKRIIPAVASTNAVIAAACTTEVLKISTNCRLPLNNYLNFNDLSGVYTHKFEAEKKSDCLVCSNKPVPLHFSGQTKLQEIVDFLIESPTYQMKAPGLRTIVNGKPKTLYMQTVPSLKMATKPNLKKTLQELELVSGQQILVADVTTPNTLTFLLQFTSSASSMSS